MTQKVADLGAGLRASEQARRQEAIFRDEEMREIKSQLAESERRRQAAALDSPGATQADREWKLRSKLAETTHEAQLARQELAVAREEQQRSSAELFARADAATKGVLRLQGEVRSSLEEREALVRQLQDAETLLESMRATEATLLGDKVAATAAAEAARSELHAAREEALDARRRLADAARSEEETHDESARQREASLAAATRAAAGAVAAAQAQAALTLAHAQEASARREAELAAEVRAACEAREAAEAQCASWEARARAAEGEADAVRLQLDRAICYVAPCTTAQMEELMRHTLGAELRHAERCAPAFSFPIEPPAPIGELTPLPPPPVAAPRTAAITGTGSPPLPRRWWRECRVGEAACARVAELEGELSTLKLQLQLTEAEAAQT